MEITVVGGQVWQSFEMFATSFTLRSDMMMELQNDLVFGCEDVVSTSCLLWNILKTNHIALQFVLLKQSFWTWINMTWTSPWKVSLCRLQMRIESSANFCIQICNMANQNGDLVGHMSYPIIKIIYLSMYY